MNINIIFTLNYERSRRNAMKTEEPENFVKSFLVSTHPLSIGQLTRGATFGAN